MQSLPERLESLDLKELEELLFSLGDYEEQPVSIDEFIDDPQFLGSFFQGGFWPYWRPVLNEIYPSPHYSPYFLCLGENTNIDLLDGRTLSIREVVEKFHLGEELYTLSYDISRGEWVPGEVIAGGQRQRRKQKVFRITLDNGKFVDATADHKFLTRSKNWKAVKNLKVGDSLLPCDTRRQKEYKMVCHADTRKWQAVYRLMGQWKFGKIPKNFVVHHKSCIPRNDNPTNLCILDFKVHFKWHYENIRRNIPRLRMLRKRWWAELTPAEYTEMCEKLSEGQNKRYLRPGVREKIGVTSRRIAAQYPEKYTMRAAGQAFWKKYNEDPKFAETSREKWRANFKIASELNKTSELRKRQSSAQMFGYHNDPKYKGSLAIRNETIRKNMKAGQAAMMSKKAWENPANREFHSKRLSEVSKDPEYQKNAQRKKLVSMAHRRFCASNTLSYNPETIDKYFDSCQEFEQLVANFNHRIVSIEYVGYQNVYDITIDKYANFSVSAGIVAHNCALRGSIGRGKTICACTGIAYDIYKLLCLKNPQKHFDLLPTTKITFAIFNVTLGLATDVVWDMLESMLASSSWFTKRVDIATQLKKKKVDDTLFPKRIDIFMGSRVGHSLGRAIFSAILSEANFDVINEQTLKSFNSLLARGESRFLGENSPFKVWIDSSEGDKASAVNKIVDSYKGKPGMYVNQGPTWEPKMHIRDKYSGKMFKIYKGTASIQPRILTTPNNAEESDLLFQTDPGNIMEVPIEHFDRFDADINMALRDLAGISTTSKYRLIKHTDRLQRCISVAPLFPDIISLDFDDDSDQIINYMKNPEYFSAPFHPDSFRYIHIDIALTGDKLGIASSFITGFKEKKLIDAVTLEETTEVVPQFMTEFAFAIECKPGQQIPLFKIRLFIKWIWEKKITIDCVSCDGFESADMLQMLQKMGLHTEECSVDRTSLPYLYLRSCVNDEYIRLPLNQLLLKELTELELSSDGKKVDHPDSGKTGSKDVADAVCGSINQANKNSQKHIFTQMMTADADDSFEKIKEMFWK